MLLAGNPLPISGLVSTQRIALPVGIRRSVVQIRLPIRVKREFFTLACSILSRTVGIPSGRFLPLGFGISTLRVGLRFPPFQLFTRITRC